MIPKFLESYGRASAFVPRFPSFFKFMTRGMWMTRNCAADFPVDRSQFVVGEARPAAKVVIATSWEWNFLPVGLLLH
jgi:hypothetical protein